MRIYGITDIGKARSINQDSYAVEVLEDAETGILLVCDGMGGVKGGEIASSIAVRTIMDSLRVKLKPKMSRQNIKNALEDAIKQANSNIVSRALEEHELLGMGTTCVCAIVCDNNITLANVGDSRAYVIENEKLRQVTEDHSLVNDMVKAGEISPQEALMHPKKNIITRALGVDEDIEIDYFNVDVKDDMYVILCSDGLTNEVSDIEICYEVVNSITEKDACEALKDIANKRGGHDNITIVVAAF
ncbi:MAG: Stp1/IreP family PP2C-type Ser/Thr phosphatase [Ruminococcaceae bacterium]|nr:Stp1/IreP family PP2C-type Ser/Thr phosphatase [Oscillospiraceae bacterium]